MKTPVLRNLLLSSFTAAFVPAAAFAGTIECPAISADRTVNGILALKFEGDGPSGPVVTINRLGVAARTSAALLSADEMHWYESSVVDGNGFVTESVSLLRTRHAGLPSTFRLRKTLDTLFGRFCDGYHACESKREVLEEVPVTCTDSSDSAASETPAGTREDEFGGD